MVDNKEKELIQNFLKGNESSFNEIIKNYQKNIYWQARRMVGNHLDADEITQEVIIVIYKKLKNFRFQSTLKTWIYKITFSRTLNYLKKQKCKKIFNFSEISDQSFKGNEDIIENFEQKEQIKDIQKKLKSLPDKQREIFILRHFEELSYEEISQITGKSIGGLKANYFHALTKILGKIKYEQ